MLRHPNHLPLTIEHISIASGLEEFVFVEVAGHRGLEVVELYEVEDAGADLIGGQVLGGGEGGIGEVVGVQVVRGRGLLL